METGLKTDHQDGKVVGNIDILGDATAQTNFNNK